MSDADHRDLLDALQAHKGPVVLSGYESRLYKDALRNWYCDAIPARAQTGGKSPRNDMDEF